MPTRPNLRIGHVAIFVRDLDKMRAFYTDILGFTVTDEGPHPVASIQMISCHPIPKSIMSLFFSRAVRKTKSTVQLSNSPSILKILMSYVRSEIVW